jgi:hypothetical protein
VIAGKSGTPLLQTRENECFEMEAVWKRGSFAPAWLPVDHCRLLDQRGEAAPCPPPASCNQTWQNQRDDIAQAT